MRVPKRFSISILSNLKFNRKLFWHGVALGLGAVLLWAMAVPSKPIPWVNLPLQAEMEEDSVGPELVGLQGESTLDPERFFKPFAEDRPWVRWVWPGTDVSIKDLMGELHWIAAQGFGGVEITLSGKGLEPSYHRGQFRDPVWIATLRQVSLRARQLKLQVDWCIGPGIPAEYSAGLHTLAWGETHVRGDQTLSILLPRPAVPIGHRLASVLAQDVAQEEAWLSWMPDSARLIGVWAGRALEDGRSVFYWNLEDAIRLDPDSTFWLQSHVRRDSLINWEGPKGYWKVIACYDMPLFQEPLGSVAAFREVLPDPYSSADWANGISVHPMFAALPGDSLAGRAISIGLQAPAADRLLPRHWKDSAAVVALGFDPTRLAPLLAEPAQDHAWARRINLATAPAYIWSDADEDIRNEYEHWLMENCLPHSIPQVTEVVRSKGSHGKLVVDEWHKGWYQLASLVALPGFRSEIGGANRLAAHWAVSGARAGGQSGRIVGHAFRHQGDSYSLSPQEARTEVDRLILSGANEITAHTFTSMYQPDANKARWQPDAIPQLSGSHYGSQFGPDDPLAACWPTLWNYLARVQYVMRLGQPSTDLLVYYPFSTFPSLAAGEGWSLRLEPSDVDLPRDQLSALSRQLLRSEKDSVWQWVQEVSPFLRQLEEWGFTWNWVSEADLANSTWTEDRLSAGGLRAKALVLPSGGLMRVATARHLSAQADLGAKVFLLGETVPKALGGNQPKAASLELVRLLHRFRLPFPVQSPEELLSWIKGEDIEAQVPFPQRQPAIRQQVRVLPDGSQIAWMVNLSASQQTASFFLPADQEVLRLNPETGLAYQLEISENRAASFLLAPLESQLIWLGPSTDFWPDSLLAKDPEWTRLRFADRLGVELRKITHWDWSFFSEDYGAVVTRADTGLWDWRRDKFLERSSTEVLYTTDLLVETLRPDQRFLLDLGEVHDRAEVSINTETLPAAMWKPFRYDLTPYLREGVNTLEIWVTNVPRNGIVGQAMRGISSAMYLKGSEEELLPAGLLGPVYLWVK